MKKFFFKALIIFGILLTVAFFLQKLIDNSVKHSALLYFQTWNDIIEPSAIKSDLIIQGSSRAKVQFSPFIIDSMFHLNTCNLGMEGTGFDLQYCRFKVLIKYNKKPKYIIQNVDCYSTLSNNVYQFEQYIPYLNNEIIRKATIEAKIFNFKDRFIPLYKYTHSLFSKEVIYDGVNCYFKKIRGKGAFENFTSHNAKWDSSFISFQKNHINGIREKIDAMTHLKFDEFIKYCKKANIKVILVYAPEYRGLQNLIINRDSIVGIYQKYSHIYSNTSFLDYSNDSICEDTANFYNSQHLNSKGVKKFNEHLIADLKSIIK